MASENISTETKEIALYQKFPGRDLTRYGMPELGIPTITVKTFPANKDGIANAIEHAERHDAVLVKLDKIYFDSESMIEAIQEKIKQKKFVLVFQPTYKMP